MTKTLSLCMLLVPLLIGATSLPSYAWHRHGGFYGGVWIDGPRWEDPFPPYPFPYPDRYYYYTPPPIIIRQQQPENYIQKEPAQEPTYWYYCPSPQGYYPYIKECPTGWMKVIPTPPSGQQEPQKP